MFLLGLTGSIGMGKSTTAKMFEEAGVPVHDSDEAVHRPYRGKATPLIEEAFPGSTHNGVVDRNLLGPKVLANPEALKRLEAIIHPLVRADSDATAFRKARRCSENGRGGGEDQDLLHDVCSTVGHARHVHAPHRGDAGETRQSKQKANLKSYAKARRPFSFGVTTLPSLAEVSGTEFVNSPDDGARGFSDSRIDRGFPD